MSWPASLMCHGTRLWSIGNCAIECPLGCQTRDVSQPGNVLGVIGPAMRWIKWRVGSRL